MRGVIATFLALLGSAAWMRSWLDAAWTAAGLLGVLGVSRVPLRPFLRGLRPFLLFGAVIVAFGGFRPDGPFIEIGLVRWSLAGLDRSGMAAARLIFLGAAAGWLNAVGGTARLLGVLAGAGERAKRIGLDVTPVVQATAVAARFLPLVEREALRLQAAWKVRGALLYGRGPLGRARYAAGLAVPLLATTLRRAEHLAEAVEVRAPKEGLAEETGAWTLGWDAPGARGGRSGAAWRDIARGVFACAPLIWRVWEMMG